MGWGWGGAREGEGGLSEQTYLMLLKYWAESADSSTGSH